MSDPEELDEFFDSVSLEKEAPVDYDVWFMYRVTSNRRWHRKMKLSELPIGAMYMGPCRGTEMWTLRGIRDMESYLASLRLFRVTDIWLEN